MTDFPPPPVMKRDRSVKRKDRLVVIATEDTYAGKQYFESLPVRNVQIRVLETSDGKSAPEWILDRLKCFLVKYQLSRDESLWLSIDFDRWTPQVLSIVAQQSMQAGIKLAVSNPCFEIWLALHLEADLPAPCETRDLEQHLKTKLPGGYNKTNIRPERLIDHVDRACTRARNLDKAPEQRWPQTPGTRVYLIIEDIRDLSLSLTV